MAKRKGKSQETDTRSFEVGGVKYTVKHPDMNLLKKGNEIRSRVFNQSLKNGDILRDQLDAELRKNKLWNDERDQEYQTLQQEVIDFEFTLQKGGIKLNEARSIALQMSEKRNRMISLLSTRTELDNNTCEGKADAARFNYLFTYSLVYEETGELYFPGGVKEYERSMDDPVAEKAASEFYYLMSESENLDDTLPENKFLKRFNFVDDEYRLVDEQGRLISADGKHISEDGKFIKWTGEDEFVYVDTEGREVTETGEFSIEESPFLDDSGKPIVLESDKKPDKPKRNSRNKQPKEDPGAVE